ncbi:hypothetical protein CHK_1902 [Christensenella hongkongensis]|uniref:Uncharacterized protein n=1 Tax=Christensenella hongkongensis TaxID=270498 RepID=A0A0M2NEK7_9FIRM|nr:hypothetical protein CHK_1902 [Christensenella hongkongensis]
MVAQQAFVRNCYAANLSGGAALRCRKLIRCNLIDYDFKGVKICGWQK